MDTHNQRDLYGFAQWDHDGTGNGVSLVVIVIGFIRHALGNPYSQDTDTHQYRL